jgi:hypothetical protein
VILERMSEFLIDLDPGQGAAEANEQPMDQR